MREQNPIQIMFFLFTIVVFSVGLYVYSTMDMRQKFENMEAFKEEVIQRDGFDTLLLPQNKIGILESKRGRGEERDVPVSTAKDEIDVNCPDILVKSGAELHLYNSKKPKQDGENPIVFNTMDDYIQYLETQRKSGTICPILYLQKENDAQGNDVYRVRPSPFNTGAGLPLTSGLKRGVNKTPITVKDASREANYNTNQHAGFDPYGLYVGRITNVDEIGTSTEKEEISDNPMDPNWGGVLYTQRAIESGKYDENIVTRSVYPTPKTEFIPIRNPSIPPMPPPV
jgi:hypothetical protein